MSTETIPFYEKCVKQSNRSVVNFILFIHVDDGGEMLFVLLIVEKITNFFTQRILRLDSSISVQ